MNDPRTAASSALAVLRELEVLTEREPRLVVGQLEGAEEASSTAAGHARPDQWVGGSEMGDSVYAWAATKARGGALPVVVGRAPSLVLDGYVRLRNDICRPRLNVKIVALNSGLGPNPESASNAVFEDVGLLRALPGVAVFAPADAPSAVAAIRAALVHDGPVYLRLPPGAWPSVTPGTFQPGKATLLNEGSDLTLLAYGPLVGQAVRAADRLGGVGIRARVLDCASLKPFDDKSIIRAARETGVLLTLEDHTPLTGLGAAVATTTTPELPVLIRSLGVPDLFPEAGPGEGVWESVGMGLDAVVDEAWELLRLRGKVQ